MEGIASWYGRPHHGRRVASGEIYDMHRLTAAHRTLPFDTIVLVQNKRNGREVNVRINDRGPFVKGRVIDLSYAAAKALDMLVPGTAPVRLKVVRSKAPHPEQSSRYRLRHATASGP
jgi:rare lipoprotein A